MDRRQADLLGLTADARSRHHTLRELPAVVVRSLALVRRAAGRDLWLATGIQIVLALLAALQVVAAAWALQALVDLDQDRTSVGAAVAPFLALVVPTILVALISVAKGQVQRVVIEKVEQDTWERVLDTAAAVDLERYEAPEFYDDLRRVEANALIRPAMVSMSVLDFVGGVLGCVVLAITLLGVAPFVLPLLVLGAVPLVLAARSVGSLEFDFAVHVTPTLRERRYLREVLVGRSEAKELRALAATASLRAHHRTLNVAFLDALRRQARRASAFGLLVGGASALATLLGLALVFVLVADGATTLAEAGAILIAVRLLGGRLQDVTGAIGRLFESSLFLADLDAFTRGGAPVPAASDETPAPPLREVRLDRASFRYPGTDRDAVHDVSIVVRPGEVVALVGENGSGKTTVSKLVAQLYRPTGGAVRWNGVDAWTFDAAGRRRQVSVTFQDFVRFALTADRNVSLGGGTLDAERADVVNAARRAGADGFLAVLPRGYDTLLGKEFADGADLSTGQWQRVALARAFFRDATLVVLDEPTSSLDPRAEAALFDVVRRLFADRAVLLVTHRLASVSGADRIYVLDEGHLVEEGGHRALLDADGLYAELFTLQAAAFLDGS